jgi:hypothetical protein
MTLSIMALGIMTLSKLAKLQNLTELKHLGARKTTLRLMTLSIMTQHIVKLIIATFNITVKNKIINFLLNVAMISFIMWCVTMLILRVVLHVFGSFLYGTPAHSIKTLEISTFG